MDVIQVQPKDQHKLQKQTHLRQLQLQKEIHDDRDNDQQYQQQSAAAAAESTAEAEINNTSRDLQYKPPEKQLPNLQEKQPYADKCICQRRQA